MSADSLLATYAPAERPIFQAVLEETQSDAPRLVYADWLEEHGDDRCEFIRLQLEIAKREAAGAAVDALRTREAEMLAANLGRWNGLTYRRLNQTALGGSRKQIRQWLRRWDYQRGFIEYLRVNAESFVCHSEILFEIGPLYSVRICHLSGWEERLAKCPALLRVRSLCMRGASYNSVHLLTRSPYVKNLEVLDISNCYINKPTARELIRSPYLSGLRELNLTSVWGFGNSIQDVASHYAGRVRLSPNVELATRFPNIIGEVNFLCGKSHASNRTS